MAELSTLARPYAEALFKVVSDVAAVRTGDELDALAAIAGAAPKLTRAGVSAVVSARSDADARFPRDSDPSVRSGVRDWDNASLQDLARSAGFASAPRRAPDWRPHAPADQRSPAARSRSEHCR